MSKEELERASVQGQSSSVPPRRASDAPTALPSIPPSTDEIDTDWGGDDADWGGDDGNEVTRVMMHPSTVPPAAAPIITLDASRTTAPPTPVAEPAPSVQPMRT